MATLFNIMFIITITGHSVQHQSECSEFLNIQKDSENSDNSERKWPEKFRTFRFGGG